MNGRIHLIKSGISLVDEAWGGLYRGGTYLLMGPKKSGRTLLGLQYAMECAKQKEVCLYFTSQRPKDLMIHAASIDLDLQSYMNQNLLIVVRVAPPSELYEMPNPDEFLVEYLSDIITVVEQYQPSRIVFDELTSFIGFNSLEMLKDAFAHTTETIEENGITSLFLLGDPATPAARQIVDILAESSTGIIYLQKNENKKNTSYSGIMTITPNIGHTEGKFSANYWIEPYKGVVVDYKREPQTEHIPTISGNGKVLNGNYISFNEFPHNPTINLQAVNFYSPDDFKLILNNQIALFKSTGHSFSLISIDFNNEAEKNNLLTLSQLQNAIRLASDRKDKICVMANKIIVLITRDENVALEKYVSKIKSNFPRTEAEFIAAVSKYIAVYSLKVDETVQGSEDILNKLAINEPNFSKESRNNYR
jgi:KaiC/GvpD/RAD55 family RecA-like ATPase